MENNHFWGIILAGGEGSRLKDFVRTQLGTSCPKQYCTFTGTRSMLRHTIDRVERLIAPDHILTIVSRDHLTHAHEELGDRPPGTVIIQPAMRGTGPGILYPLLHIYERDPYATIALFPSDHFVLEEERFVQYVSYASEFTACFPRTLVILGVEPTGPEMDYGWIKIQQANTERGWEDIHAVEMFIEKPNHVEVQRLMRERSLWNTMVLVGQAAVFLRHVKNLTPQVYHAFQRIQKALNSRREHEEAEKVYAHLPSVNFSHAVLAKIPHGLSALSMKHVHWSDWGHPQRILSDLQLFSKITISDSHVQAQEAMGVA